MWKKLETIGKDNFLTYYNIANDFPTVPKEFTDSSQFYRKFKGFSIHATYPTMFNFIVELILINISYFRISY